MVKKPTEDNKRSDSEIKYKGVRKRKWGKWVSEIRLPNSRERIWLGSYDSPEKAARAFDAAQFCLRGHSANFNFPNNPPEISRGQPMTPLEIQSAAARFANATAGEVVILGGDDPKVEDESEDYSLSYSPSISDETTVSVQMDSEMAGVELSFHELLSLSTTFGSGNYGSDFGFYNEFDDFTARDFYVSPQLDNFEYVAQDDTYDATFYQESYLWNF